MCWKDGREEEIKKGRKERKNKRQKEYVIQIEAHFKKWLLGTHDAEGGSMISGRNVFFNPEMRLVDARARQGRTMGS